ncbi:MAG TPA: DUF1207 domain-containing protein [bacterium]|nr:DUF1207 domain-containing protein [bacterium]
MRKKAFTFAFLCELCVLCGSILFCFSPLRAEEWVFLPERPLFHPLIADPREPHLSATAYLNQTQWEGAIGQAFEFLRYKPGDGEWGWGLLASAFTWLDEDGATFPMRDSDWYLGTYISQRPTGSPLSFRLEYLHVSSHLGDALSSQQARIIYTRESFRLTGSYDPLPEWRLYAGGGYYGHIAPAEPPWFFHAGTEIYSQPFQFLDTNLRLYAAYDLKVKQEAGGVTNHAIQIGFQWKPKDEKGQVIRLALTYFNGNAEWGQFYQQKDEHLGLGLFFDP